MRVNVIRVGADGNVAVPTTEELADASLSQLATWADKDWRERSKSGVWFGAKPWLNAMRALDTVEDQYGADDGRTVVAYFLTNATTWKGELARAVKAELKRRVK